jgi:hypothetical protein
MGSMRPLTPGLPTGNSGVAGMARAVLEAATTSRPRTRAADETGPLRLTARLLLAVTLLAAAVGSARADTPIPEAQADALMRQAFDLRRQGDNARALELLRQAQALSPSGRVLAQVGFAEFALQQWVDAEAHLQQALASHDSAWMANSKTREMLEKTLTETRHHVARLDVRGTAGAEIAVDGKPAGTLPLPEPIHIAAGTVRLTASAPGRQGVERTILVAGGAEISIPLDLAPLPVSPGPMPAPTPPAASPTLLAAAAAGEARAVPAWRRWTGAGLFVLGLATIGTGVAWVAVDGHPSCASPTVGRCPTVYDTKTDGWISIAVGAVGAGAGATLFFWTGRETTPAVAVGPGMLAFYGRF